MKSSEMMQCLGQSDNHSIHESMNQVIDQPCRWGFNRERGRRVERRCDVEKSRPREEEGVYRTKQC